MEFKTQARFPLPGNLHGRLLGHRRHRPRLQGDPERLPASLPESGEASPQEEAEQDPEPERVR